eukprot:NODE_135_length_16508_cov_1.365897.p13 type:complete len:178 gc:universal NODE_135_length_16508_cov_1.365897:8071-8604(+)
MPNRLVVWSYGVMEKIFQQKDKSKQLIKANVDTFRKLTKTVILEMNSKYIQTDIGALDFAVILEKAYKSEFCLVDTIQQRAIEKLYQAYNSLDKNESPSLLRQLSLPSLDEIDESFLFDNEAMRRRTVSSPPERKFIESNQQWSQVVLDSIISQGTVGVTPYCLTIEIPSPKIYELK